MTAAEALRRLHDLAAPEAAKSAARFFKCGPGDYGEGDQFIGIRVPVLRSLAREFRWLPFAELDCLLESPIHESRHLALIILTASVSRAKKPQRQAAYDFYLARTDRINNWDLVDCSAPAVVGGHLVDEPRSPLVRLAKSKWLWDRRIAIVATQHFIRRGEFDDTLTVARLLLRDTEDLIHKATGWMLREVGERDVAALELFLGEHAAAMPRTMLRTAVETMPADRRARFLAR